MSRLPLPWSTLLAVSAASALLLAFFHARAGGSVGVVAALVIATALGLSAVITARGPRRRHSSLPTLSPPPDAPAPSPLPPFPNLTALPTRPAVAPPPPLAPLAADTGPLPTGRLARVATELARAAVAQLSAPASSLLISRDGRLRAAGSAGDWGAARRGVTDLAGAGLYDAAHDGGEPPEFPLDPRNDWLPRLLALYGRPVPMERWHELSDVPAPLLPLVALAASGVGVAIPLSHRRRLAGLWVLAQRVGGPYTDDELGLLQRLARDHSRSLAEALED